MLLPRRSRHDIPFLLPSLLGLVTVIFLCGEIAITSTTAQNYDGSPPRYSYNNLPRTSFSCKGRLPGRYYPDPETDCQMFHVCVRMSQRDVQDFKFLCPNGTVFDSEHQVCIDYYQVVCHTGTNPLGQIFEIFKLGSGHETRDLDTGKLAPVNRNSVERNTLGDDFQVEEYNTNRLASSRNTLNFRSSDPDPSPKPGRSHKAKEDIFFGNKGFAPSAFDTFPSSTRRTPLRTTTTTTTTTTTEAPSSSTPRRPSLETFESYETESFSGFIPARNNVNNFGAAKDPSPDFDASTEDLTTRDDNDRFRNTKATTTSRPFIFPNTEATSTARPFFFQNTESTTTSRPYVFKNTEYTTTSRPYSFKNTEYTTSSRPYSFKNTDFTTTSRPFVFQNTFRTTLSHIPSTARPSAQTFQQQASRFNDEFFTRVPSTTRRPVSKAAQFFLHSTTADDYFTPEYRQPTANPFVNHRRPQSSSTSTTTIRPALVFQSNSGTVRPKFNVRPTTDFQYDISTTAAPTTTTTTTEGSTTTEFFGRYSPTDDDFETKQTTYSGFIPTTKNSNFFGFNNQDKSNTNNEFEGKSSAQRQFPPQLSSQYVEEEALRPRNINGASNSPNAFNNQGTLDNNRPRDNFGFSTVPPPTTAEPFSTPPPTTASSAVTQQETAQTLATRLQGQLFKKVTTKNPEKFSIFFGRSTPSISDERLPAPGPTRAYYDNRSTTTKPRTRVKSTTANPLEIQQTSASDPAFDRRGRLSRFNSPTTTVLPDTTTTQKPLRRGVRRRVRPGSRPEGEVKTFDPQLKYTRRRFESGRGDKEGVEGGEQKNDEIFNAEASVFRGDPSINNFFQDRRKGASTGSQKVSDEAQKDQQSQQQGKRQPVNQFEQFYGRRVRPNGGAGPQQNNNEGNFNNGEERRRPPLPPGSQNQIKRRVVKRLRPKNGTDAQSDGSTPNKQFVVTGSTLRPVLRINVKSKLGGKISTTYRTTEITDGSSSPTPSTTTTEEPELITASDDVVEEIRNRNQGSSSPVAETTNQPILADSGLFTKRPFRANKFNNGSHLVIKVVSEKPFPVSPPTFSSPLSIKKPILSAPGGKRLGKPPGVGGKKNAAKSSSNVNEEESQTKSPDYDYAYYNNDDASDYDSETSNLDHKNYGKKPRNNKEQSK